MQKTKLQKENEIFSHSEFEVGLYNIFAWKRKIAVQYNQDDYGFLCFVFFLEEVEEGQRKRENLKQAPHPVQSPMQGWISQP